jgi:hypothetical protein
MKMSDLAQAILGFVVSVVIGAVIIVSSALAVGVIAAIAWRFFLIGWEAVR